MIKSITVPNGEGGVEKIAVEWACIYCGAPRGEESFAVSYDTEALQLVSSWSNSCGHVEKYSAVREVAYNGR